MRRLRNGSVKKTAFLSAFAIVLNQSGWTMSVSAENLSYEGTTEMSTVEYSLELDGVTTELVVEEVYVEAGEQLEEGDQILKLTEESYQDALDYYEAAVLRAENTLTDTKREYEQGILEAKSEYEMTKTEADQAEFVREYQEQELADTITAYEEIQPEIEEKISEVQSGINNGSYSSQSSPGGSSFGGSGGGAGGSMDSFGSPETEQDGGNGGAMPDTEAPDVETPDGETSDTEAPDAETPDGETPGTETSDGEMPDTENPDEETPETEIPETEIPDTGEEDNGSSEDETQDDAEEFQQQVESLKKQIESSAGNYEEILSQIKALLSAEGETDASGGGDENNLAASLRTSVEVDSTISQHMKNVREMVNNIPDTVIEAIKLAGIEYESYIALLDECIAQMDAGLTLQKNVLAVLEAEDYGQDSLDTETLSSLLEQLGTAWSGTMDLYAQLSALQEGQVTKQEEEIKELQEQIADLKKQQEEEQPEGQQGEQPEGQQEEQEEGQQGEQQARPGSEDFSDGTEGETAPGVGESEMSGSDVSGANAGTGSAFAGGTGSFGGSMGSIGGEVSGEISAGISMDDGGDGTLTMEDLNLTEEDISLFGTTYDLSQVESLLDQEPADSETAENLLDQLEEAKATVSGQYEELIRNQKATELGIQYTYETSVLAGKLAEITYEQELEEWEESLAEAENTRAEMEEKKEALSQMTDGIITADTGGTVAAVNYEADDVLDSSVPVLSFYDTEKVFVTIAVPQENIAQMQVGDTVEVNVGGRQELSGKITEKAMEEQEGNSRTTVNYEVTVTVDNENGRLSAGSSATVTADTTGKEKKASEEDSQNE